MPKFEVRLWGLGGCENHSQIMSKVTVKTYNIWSRIDKIKEEMGGECL